MDELERVEREHRVCVKVSLTQQQIHSSSHANPCNLPSLSLPRHSNYPLLLSLLSSLFFLHPSLQGVAKKHVVIAVWRFQGWIWNEGAVGRGFRFGPGGDRSLW
eukprot:998810-Amorphochlora_amoeboformis.AAC.1